MITLWWKEKVDYSNGSYLYPNFGSEFKQFAYLCSTKYHILSIVQIGPQPTVKFVLNILLGENPFSVKVFSACFLVFFISVFSVFPAISGLFHECFPSVSRMFMVFAQSVSCVFLIFFLSISGAFLVFPVVFPVCFLHVSGLFSQCFLSVS